jgi:hypothetical protein
MKKHQKIPLDGARPGTGPMQFGDDWPGVFIRGDDAIGYVRWHYVEPSKDWSRRIALQWTWRDWPTWLSCSAPVGRHNPK